MRIVGNCNATHLAIEIHLLCLDIGRIFVYYKFILAIIEQTKGMGKIWQELTTIKMVNGLAPLM